MQAILYLEVNIVCIAILFMIYIRDAKQRNNDTYHILFTKVLFSNILFFISDIAWGLIVVLKSPYIAANWVVNIVYFSMSGVVAYFWQIFVEKTIDPDYSCSKVHTAFLMMPSILLIVLSVVSIKTHWLFYIDAAGHYQRGDLHVLQLVLAYMLPIYATVLSVKAFLNTSNFEKKHQYRSLALFYLPPAIGGILQILIEGTPMLNIGMALSGLWVYFDLQDNIIMIDSLTKINNRRYFDKSLEEMLHGSDADSGKYLWLIMMDIDYFKKINDGFGHAEGDRALITIAEVLKDAAKKFNCITARIGGDEFAVCCRSDNDKIPEEICSFISEELIDRSANYAFKLRLSFGCSVYQKDMTPQQLYIAADSKLYEAKKAR